jgi:hypothetical protein
VSQLTADSKRALESIDRFVAVAGEIAELPILRRPDFRPAADALYRIAQLLLDANENLARWLHLFLQFNFHGGDARQRFLDLVQRYRTAKAGQELRQMKFRCGDISVIYWNHVAGKMSELYPSDEHDRQRAEMAFGRLANADDDMVALIYETVVAGIDGFLADAERNVDRSDLNAAEARRLAFKVASAPLSQQVERLGAELSDLVLRYARLAHRSVTLTAEGG